MKGILFLLAVFITFGYCIEVVEPFYKEINSGDEIYLGVIGPGQTIFIDINPKVDTGGINNIGGFYDLAIASNQPAGWKHKESKLYGDPLHLEITASEDALEGEYINEVKVIDEANGEGLGNITFNARVTVSMDVMDASVSPEMVSTGPDQPARIYITINNKGTASDVFEVRGENLKKWDFTKYVYVSARDSKTVVYEIAESEEEVYHPKIIVESTSSSLIRYEKEIVVKVNSDLWNDYKATNHGTLIFPILDGPIYALAGLISNLW